MLQLQPFNIGNILEDPLYEIVESNTKWFSNWK